MNTSFKLFVLFRTNKLEMISLQNMKRKDKVLMPAEVEEATQKNRLQSNLFKLLKNFQVKRELLKSVLIVNFY